MYNKRKLNVTDKVRSNPFSWRGQFTPELIEYLLDIHARPNSLVADPFSGSGTVLLECSKRGIDAVGCEVNPSAYAMSKFFEFGTYSFSEKWNLCMKTVRSIPLSGLKVSSPLYQKKFSSNYRKAYENLIHFAKKIIDAHSTKSELVLLLNIIFKMENCKKLNLGQAWNKAYNEISSFLFSLPESESKISASLCDARIVDKQVSRPIDLIITSPPYINVFNYHQNHRMIMELLDFDILSVAHSEFGSNRKNRGNRFLTVIQYCIDMLQALDSMQKAMSNDGKAIMVIGRESNVRKTAFYNGKIVIDLCRESDIFDVEHIAERHFRNKFGKTIYEDILVLSPGAATPDIINIARVVAKDHLQNAVNRVPDESKNDLSNAMDSLDNVQPSPLFEYRSQK